MKHKSLVIYFVILTILCAGFILGAKALGEQGMYLVQGYMLTPAIAALITRLSSTRRNSRTPTCASGGSAITANSG